MSLIPVRCYTCNKVIGNKWEPYVHLLAQGLDENTALTSLGIRRYCCKRMIITHVDIMESLLNHSEVKNNDHQKHQE